jgi:hypothetical protein
LVTPTSCSPASRRAAGPFLGNRHAANPHAELGGIPGFYFMPNTERLEEDPDYFKNDE